MNFARLADAVRPAPSDASTYTSLADASPDEEDDGEVQGTIQLPPPQTDTDCGSIREELDNLVASVTADHVNAKNVLHSVVVDVSCASYNNRNIFKTYLLYLGGFLMAGDDDWPAVAGNLRKARKIWTRMMRILGR